MMATTHNPIQASKTSPLTLYKTKEPEVSYCASVQANSPQSEDGFINRPKDGFYAVFDGHGGAEATDFLQENMWGYLSNSLRRPQSDVKRNVQHAINCLDRDLIHTIVTQEECIYSGSCAIMSYVDRLRKTAYVFNIGDCRAVLGKKQECVSGRKVYKSQQLSTDHNCTNHEEIERVKQSSGDLFAVQVSPNDPYAGTENATLRVAGYLAVTRSFGDPYLKVPEISKIAQIRHSKYISNEAEFFSLPIACEDDFIILASDGLWEVVTNEEAVQVISKKIRMRKRLSNQDSKSSSDGENQYSNSSSDQERVSSDSDLSNHDDVHSPQRLVLTPNRGSFRNRESPTIIESAFEQIFSPSRWFSFTFLSLTVHSSLISPKTCITPSERDEKEIPDSYSSNTTTQDEDDSGDEMRKDVDHELEKIFKNDDLSQILIDYALLRVARRYEMSLEGIKRLPPQVRRSFHDDITVIVFFLK